MVIKMIEDILFIEINGNDLTTILDVYRVGETEEGIKKSPRYIKFKLEGEESQYTNLEIINSKELMNTTKKLPEKRYRITISEINE